MRWKIAAGIALLIGALVFQYLTFFRTIIDCPARVYDYRPVLSICVPAVYLEAIIIVEICMAIGGGLLIFFGLRARLTKSAMPK